MAGPLVVPALLAFAASALAAAPHTWPQDPPPATAAPEPPQQAPQPQQGPLDATTRAALERLATVLQERRAARDAAQTRNDADRVAALEREIQELEWQFGGLATRFDVRDFESPSQSSFDLRQELEQLIRPALEALKDATAEPRQVADLRARIEQLSARQRLAEAALRAAEHTRDQLADDAAARAEVQRELEQRWRPTIQSLRDEVLFLSAQLQAKEQGRQSLVDGVSTAVQNFVQSSGTSLLLAVLVFLSVFVGLRWLAGRVLKRRRAERAFGLRLLEIVVQALILLVAIAATLVVPYSRNDWLLLAVCIVFLLGAGWALVKMLPQFFEQIRLALNIGGVREGERILVDGLPYRVDTLRFYSRLHNPALSGGDLRVPIRNLIGMRSRRGASDEPWFPTHTGDVVLLGDGQFGTVRMQSPEVVVVEQYGTERTYPTGAFLELNPQNLSRGFAVRATVGIDYGHQADAVQAIPATLQQFVHEGLAASVGSDQLQHVRVELAAAGASSLDLFVVARFEGSAAPRYLQLERLVQALFVAACNQNGWRIPFPQLTLHRAAE